MTSTAPRTRVNRVRDWQPPRKRIVDGKQDSQPEPFDREVMTCILHKSHGNPIDRRTGDYRSGGGFYTVATGEFISPGYVSNACNNKMTSEYSGPVFAAAKTDATIGAHFNTDIKDKDLSGLDPDGATAIALVAPTNPTANLSTTIGESMREGIPSLPGIKLWKEKTNFLKGIGSEYLNYQFGWSPLKSEVDSVVNATRRHRDILQNYHSNEGVNVHRRFEFDPEVSQWEAEAGASYPILGQLSTNYIDPNSPGSECKVVVRNERKRWFEGCFTYGGSSKVDSFNHAIGFGSDADKLYGTDLTPDVLWNLTPWSWAVDWFTNTGDLIHNLTNFANAGLVMRYGYMMEETISTYSTFWSDAGMFTYDRKNNKLQKIRAGGGSRGLKTTTKARSPANPFGFGVSWEGLSPTQLAITAAIGITRFL
jgi:hypothetical protein